MALIDPVQAAATYGRQAKPQPEMLVRTHMTLVRKLAWHVHGRVASAIDIEDLVQIGMVALVEAANSFEDRGHAFATYATLRIRGAMIDHLRRHASICRAAMARRRELAAVRARL
jgi:RNA polymerase sigma factor for flagellar operon FliA